MVGGGGGGGVTNGCEGVNIIILSVVHLSKFGCFFFFFQWLVWCFLCCSSHAQSNCMLSLTVVFSSGPAST